MKKKVKSNTLFHANCPDGNPFRRGTVKRALFQLSLDHEGGFTKDQWLEMAIELYEKSGWDSEIWLNRGSDAWAKAWWNEFASKHQVIVELPVTE